MITHSSKTDSDKTQDTSGKIDKAKTVKPNPLRGDIVNSDLLLAPQRILQLQKNIGNQAVMQLLRSQLQQQSVGQPGQRMESEKDEIQVSQLKRIVPKAINGLTHLVKLTPDGHIYNENYLENEVCEVHFGDLLMVDLDEALYSRRGINQEVNAASDRDKEPSHLWLQAVEFNQEPLTDTYVREEMLKEPVKIDIPSCQSGS
ncbi:MAG: hypothetical protein A4E53_00824 [Pelotomaculum sp. PtaB.Bin104]|nr:MAG: hypothetical protein A4E53_00824 [Pelotomaculum sp. PtaB.Bin104]